MSNLYELSQTGWQTMLDRDEQMQPGFVDFQNFAQGFGFARRKATLGQGFHQTYQLVGFLQNCDTREARIVEMFNYITHTL